MKRSLPVVSALLLLCVSAVAAEVVQLPAPEKSGGVTLSKALSLRQTGRGFVDSDFTLQEISNLLWSAAGVNRPDRKKVYAVAMNRQDMTVYVINRQGVYRYDPAANVLHRIREGDFRAKTGGQPFVGKAAVNLAYVQDMSLWKDTPEMEQRGRDWGFVHAGEITQGAYLHSATQGWTAVVRGMFDQDTMKELLSLEKDQFVRLVHSIGPGE